MYCARLAVIGAVVVALVLGCESTGWAAPVVGINYSREVQVCGPASNSDLINNQLPSSISWTGFGPTSLLTNGNGGDPWGEGGAC